MRTSKAPPYNRGARARHCAMEAWAAFVAGLSPSQTDRRMMVHKPGGGTYMRTGSAVGCGKYGRVFAFVSRDAPPGTPRGFALKVIPQDASCELAAIEALRGLGAALPESLVMGAVLRRLDDGGAEVCMPLFEGTIRGVITIPSPRNAVVISAISARVMLELWDQGLAYCDLKLQNILFRSEGAGVTMALGDLGSIVERDGAEPGVFTYPPPRTVHLDTDEADGEDGMASPPTEQDLVWSLAVLALAVACGEAFVVEHLSSAGIRAHARAAGDRLEGGVARACAEAAAAAERMRSAGGVGAELADLVHLGLAAGHGDEDATLVAAQEALQPAWEAWRAGFH